MHTKALFWLSADVLHLRKRNYPYLSCSFLTRPTNADVSQSECNIGNTYDLKRALKLGTPYPYTFDRQSRELRPLCEPFDDDHYFHLTFSNAHKNLRYLAVLFRLRSLLSLFDSIQPCCNTHILHQPYCLLPHIKALHYEFYQRNGP